MDSFGSMSDLYRKLRKKEEKTAENRYDLIDRRRRDDDIEATYGRRRRRRENDYEDSDEESIYSSGSLVRQEYDRGFNRLGDQFAVGDCERNPSCFLAALDAILIAHSFP